MATPEAAQARAQLRDWQDLADHSADFAPLPPLQIGRRRLLHRWFHRPPAVLGLQQVRQLSGVLSRQSSARRLGGGSSIPGHRETLLRCSPPSRRHRGRREGWARGVKMPEESLPLIRAGRASPRSGSQWTDSGRRAAGGPLPLRAFCCPRRRACLLRSPTSWWNTRRRAHSDLVRANAHSIPSHRLATQWPSWRRLRNRPIGRERSVPKWCAYTYEFSFDCHLRLMPLPNSGSTTNSTCADRCPGGRVRETGSDADHARPEVGTWKASSPFDPRTGGQIQRAKINWADPDCRMRQPSCSAGHASGVSLRPSGAWRFLVGSLRDAQPGKLFCCSLKRWWGIVRISEAPHGVRQGWPPALPQRKATPLGIGPLGVALYRGIRQLQASDIASTKARNFGAAASQSADWGISDALRGRRRKKIDPERALRWRAPAEWVTRVVDTRPKQASTRT